MPSYPQISQPNGSVLVFVSDTRQKRAISAIMAKGWDWTTSYSDFAAKRHEAQLQALGAGDAPAAVEWHEWPEN